MTDLEIENLMIEKFRITKKQAIEIREKIDKYIEEFEEKNLYENLYKYLESELKNRYLVKGIGEKNIKDISRKYIRKKNDCNNLEGYYSFLGYILTVIGQVMNFIPSKFGAIWTFIISAVVLLLLNKFAMKVVRNHADFLKEFNNSFPSLIVVSVIVCLAINICGWKLIFSVIAVLGINCGLVILYFFAKYLKNKRKNYT